MDRRVDIRNHRLQLLYQRRIFTFISSSRKEHTTRMLQRLFVATALALCTSSSIVPVGAVRSRDGTQHEKRKSKYRSSANERAFVSEQGEALVYQRFDQLCFSSSHSHHYRM